MIALVCLCACNSKPGRKGILSEVEMKQVMWDLLQVDEYASYNLPHDSTKNKKKERSQLYKEVFALHKIEEAAYFQSLDFYKTHPSYYKELLDSVAAYGTRKREAGFLKQHPIPDSLKPQ